MTVGSDRASQQIADLVLDSLRPLLSRRRLLFLEILTNWADMVGPSLSSVTYPEKLRASHGGSNIAKEGEKQSLSTLEISCRGKRGLFLQYEVPRLIERINSYFGYHVIGDIRIIQDGIPPKTSFKERVSVVDHVSCEMKRERLSHLSHLLSGVTEDFDLREALEKLGEQVLSREEG